MTKRLLNQEEFEEAELEENWEGDYNPILKAQVIKLDKWWIK